MSKIYLASSWRNDDQPGVVTVLREAGHEVFDFRRPDGGDHDQGFHWSDIDRHYKLWTMDQLIQHTHGHPLTEAGFNRDFEAMKWCDTCVMLTPCGRSASLELGYCAGAGKRTAILYYGEQEPELMYRVADYATRSLRRLVHWLEE